MSAVDRERIGAREGDGGIGLHIRRIRVDAPQGGVPFPCLHGEADAMHALLVLRADKLVGCTEGCEFEKELKMIADTVSASDAKRWPDGGVRGGLFDTDEAAKAEFNRCIAEEGIVSLTPNRH
jgi:hypothetical protein